MRLLAFVVAMVTLGELGNSADFESRFFVETENAYYFETATMSGMLPTYLPKKDIRIEDKGLDEQGRVQMEASLFYRTPGLPEFDQVTEAVPPWRGKPFDFYPSFVTENCTFNREIDGEIKATSPFPTRKGTTVSSFGVKFCRFGVLFRDTQENREILAKAAADQTLISSGIEKHRVILKNAKIPTEVDATAIHRTLVDGFGGDTIAITESQALFLTGVAVAKVHKPEVVAALGLEQNDDALRKLLGMVFVERGGEFSLKIGAPDGENPIVNVIGTKTINLDI